MTAGLTVDLRPVEIDGQHWVIVGTDGHEARRYGPFPDIDTAAAMARRLLGVIRTLTNGGGKWATS